jgi:hypothetical protein
LTTLRKGQESGQIFPDSGNIVSALDSVTILREIQNCDELNFGASSLGRHHQTPPFQGGFCFSGVGFSKKSLDELRRTTRHNRGSLADFLIRRKRVAATPAPRSTGHMKMILNNATGKVRLKMSEAEYQKLKIDADKRGVPVEEMMQAHLDRLAAEMLAKR